MLIGIADEIETIRPFQLALSVDRANLAVRFAMAKRIYNFVVSRFNGESFSSISSFIDSQYFTLRGSLVPVPAPIPPQQLEINSPIFKDFNVLLLSLLKPNVPTSTNPLIEGKKVWENIFKSVFVDWLGLSIDLPVGATLGSLPISTPATYTTDFYIDPTAYSKFRLPTIPMTPIAYSNSPIAFPPTFVSQLAVGSNPTRPFFGISQKVVWDLGTITAMANSFFVELGVLNAKVTDPNLGMRNTWNLFEKYLLQALNTSMVITATLPSQVYANPSCVSAPVSITTKIWWI